MIEEPRVSLFELVMCLSEAVDLVSPTLADHHKRVAYIAVSLARELGLPIERQNEIALAGALHDIGALSLGERLSLLEFEAWPAIHQHGEAGYSLLKSFQPFSNLAPLVRYHHVPWNKEGDTEFAAREVPANCHILHVADRTAILMKKEQEILGQVGEIKERITAHSGEMFRPDLVDVFLTLAQKEYFWLDMVSPSIGSTLSAMVTMPTTPLKWEDLRSLARLFAYVMDFRSSFTATHSSGVAACARLLARFANFFEPECALMEVAGYLHDLGKLAVAKEILEKPGPLSAAEWNTMRSHTYHTFRTLEHLSGFDAINKWSSLHHERLDGSGYPFHHLGQDIPVGSRVMAVADVFTALAEDRPYRKRLSSDEALQVMQNMADYQALDPDIVLLLRDHVGEIDSVRIAAQSAGSRAYHQPGLNRNVPF